MPQKKNDAGDDFVQSIKDTLSFKPQRQALSDAVDRAKSALGFSSPKSDQPSKPARDTSLDDAAVQRANDSFKPKPGAGAKPATPSYKTGTDYVPKTGPAKLHKGEAVLKKEDAEKYREEKMNSSEAMKGAAVELGGKEEKKPKKEIKHIKTEKAKSGGYIHTHAHTRPEHHPDEQHVSKDQDAMLEHMMQHMGAPNDGEQEADAGQSGIPAQAASGAQAPPPAAA